MAQPRYWRANTLVGCDGGHSIVREQIGIPAAATTSISSWC
jgi:2-polyprenyl-6-methoxyphenol hydroxylase-like FAD-dependent oxidoreductase